MGKRHDFLANGGPRLTGGLRVPGDKSVSHRSVMLGAIAQGTTRVTGFLAGADALSTCAVFRALGVRIDGPHDGRLTVHGVGLHGLRAPAGDLDCGNAGTAMRLLIGLLAGQSFACRLVGDASLSARPMRRVTDPLTAMGARLGTRDGRPPVDIAPAGKPLLGIDYPMPVASAQVKSALLLAGLYAEGVTRVTEPAPTRDHTERMLAGFGVEVARAGATVSVRGGQSLRATDIDVPADISSAAFFIVGASIAPGSDLTLEHVGLNPTRTGIIEIMRQMGASIEISNEKTVGGEPVGDLRVRAAPLRGIDIPPALVPLAIDEFPVLFVAAACAEGITRLSGAEELRVKESDRIAVMADGLRALGVAADPTEDGMVIRGAGPGSGPVFDAGTVESHGDHRVAMAFAVASLRARGTVRIRDTANVATSFPGFEALAASVGLQVRTVEGGTADGPGATA